MSYTKANLADVASSQTASTEAGAAAGQSGERAHQVSGQMRGGVDEVTAALEGHFRTLADALRSHADATRNQLGTTDWEGRSQDAAVRAEAHMNQRVNQTMTSAEEGTQAFKAMLTSQAGEFVEVVAGQFNTVMGSIDTAYADLATAQATFAENLTQADETIQFTG